MPTVTTQNDREFFVFLVKELITPSLERIAQTQERLTEIAQDHEKRLSTIEIEQEAEKEAGERRGLHKERVWAVLFALSSIVYTVLYLLELLRIFP